MAHMNFISSCMNAAREIWCLYNKQNKTYTPFFITYYYHC